MKTFFDDHIYVQTTAQELKDLYKAVSNLVWEWDEPEFRNLPEFKRYEQLRQDLITMLQQQPWW